MTPEKIGRYEITRELGRGGMAVVYLAQDPSMKRQVAVKVLPRQFTFDSQFRARFEREAQVIAALEHPAIVPVYDFGEHDGQPYIVMRFMSGGTLGDLLRRRGPLSLAESARVFQAIAGALDEAHRKGIVHRDLKPGNILFDSRGYPAIADFGIVKVTESTANFTGDALIGTPGYMSPEQARGDSEIDARSDIYALGTILFEMLTGQLPYKSDTPMGVVMKHILDPVPSILQAKPDLPAGTENVISTAMAKERDKRFSTTSEMARALANVAAANPTLALSGSSATEVMTGPPRPGTNPPGLSTPPPGSLGTGGMAVPGSSPDVRAVPAETPAKSRNNVLPYLLGCLGLFVCAVLGLGSLGLLNNIFGDERATPTVQVAEATATPAEPVVTETPVVTPTVEANNNLPADFTSRQSGSLGISLAAPESWFSQEESGAFAVASSEAALNEDDTITEGGILYITTQEMAEFQIDDPAAFLQIAAPNLALSEDQTVLEPPVAMMINEQAAALMTVQGTTDEDGTAYLALIGLIIHEERFALIVGATPQTGAETYRPTLEAIINTIVISVPGGGIDSPEGYLEYGETVNSELREAGGGVSWGITGGRNDILDVHIVSLNSDFDPIVDVLDAEGNSILRGGPVDQSISDETIERLRLPADGDYFIIITGYNNTTGAFELTVEPSQSN